MHRFIILLSCVCFTFTNCQVNEVEIVTNEHFPEEINLDEKMTKIVERNYSVKTGDTVLVRIYEYNLKNGIVTDLSHKFFKNDSTSSYNQLFCDDKGNVIRSQNWHQFNTVLSTSYMKRDSYGNIILNETSEVKIGNIYGENTIAIKLRTKNKYENGKLIEKKTEDANGAFVSHNLMTYDDNGNMIEKIEKTMFSDTKTVSQYKYNEENQLISHKIITDDYVYNKVHHYDDSLLVKTTWHRDDNFDRITMVNHFIYDENGNLIQKKTGSAGTNYSKLDVLGNWQLSHHFSHGKLSSVTTREYIYK